MQPKTPQLYLGHVFLLDGAVKAEHCDVLLTGALLRLDQSRGAIDANKQVARHLHVEQTKTTECYVSTIRDAGQKDIISQTAAKKTPSRTLATNLGVERSTVAGLLHPQDIADPSNDFV